MMDEIRKPNQPRIPGMTIITNTAELIFYQLMVELERRSLSVSVSSSAFQSRRQLVGSLDEGRMEQLLRRDELNPPCPR